MAKELLYPHKPKSRQPLYPHTVHLSESDVIRLAESWLNEWATKFKKTCPGLRIATEGDLISFDHIGYSVVIDIPLIELVKKHREVLPALKYAVAHEFGHAVSLNRYGIEAYMRKLLLEYPELEEEADNIAEQLTGLTNKQAWDLMEWYEDDTTTPFSPHVRGNPGNPDFRQIYDAAIETAREATRKFRAIQDDYRNNRIEGVEFLKGKADHDRAQAEFDAAETAFISAEKGNLRG